ncbi:hypothetical protein ACFXKW_26510 [Streptomyces sp. NPDC059193]|uniref:DUF7715 family protein n=1 Tax=Streptomyces sp. NPDC059193 TaxID=3346763 RepID=UPI0036887FBF
MKLVISASDTNYNNSPTDYSWTYANEILIAGSDGAFVGISSGKYTTRGRVAHVAMNREEVTAQVVEYLTREGFYEPGRVRQSAETRKRMSGVFGLARGLETGAVIELREGRPRRSAAPTTV